MSNWNEIIKTKELQPNEVDVVIYHDPCSDGTGSGYVAWKYFTTNFPNKEITYYPMMIGSSPPSQLENKNVLICDYSYKKDVLINLLTKVNKLLIIDHHKSAEKDLQDIDDKYKIFHMGHSGAMLTWFYFYGDIKPPLMIEYIQDRDIWTKKLSNTDDFASWFYTLPIKFEEYDKYLDDNVLLEMIKTKGISFGELNNYYINQSIDHVVPKFCKIKNKYYFVAYVNSTVCKSDIGNQIFNKFPLVDFSVAYSINDNSNSTSFSLRSTDKHADVSEIAFSLGAGGHRNASGLRLDHITNHMPGKTYDTGQLYKLLDKIYFGNLEHDNKELYVTYLNSSLYKYEFATYLMQKKYTDKDKYDVQVSENLYKIKNNSDEKHKSDIIIIFDYDIQNNVTEFNVLFDESFTNDIKKDILSKYTNDFDDKNKLITFTTTGILNHF